MRRFTNLCQKRRGSIHAHDGDERPGDPLATVFRTLAHPIRARTLAALADAADGLRYEPLRERVALRDNGKFNYHLGELRERFVVKREERYRLTPVGQRAHELVVEGTLGTVPAERTFRTDSACLECGRPLHATYDGVTFRLDCPACGSCVRSVRFPPGGVATRDDAALLDAVDTAVRRDLSSLGSGVCPRCSGRVAVDARATDWHRDAGPRSLAFGFEYHCRECRAGWTATAGEVVLDHPAVAGFYHDHGIDLRDRYAWDLEFAATDHDTRVRSRDPLRLELRPQCGNDELVVIVGADGSVVRTARHTKFTARGTWFDRPAASRRADEKRSSPDA